MIQKMAFTELMSNEDTEEQVELIEVDLAGAVRVQHIKHVVDLFWLQIGHVPYYVVELNVYIMPHIAISVVACTSIA